MLKCKSNTSKKEKKLICQFELTKHKKENKIEIQKIKNNIRNVIWKTTTTTKL